MSNPVPSGTTMPGMNGPLGRNQSQESPKRSRIFPGWLLVGAVLIASMLSAIVVVVSPFGVITANWTDEFGWTQVQMAGALSAALLAMMVAVPVVGITVDRFGTRRVALGGTLAFAAVLALGGMLIHSLASLYMFYVLFGLVGAFTNPVTYIPALTAWFDHRRGVALGLAVAGQGLGSAVLPITVEGLVRSAAWPIAFYGIALAMVCLVMPLIFVFIHDSPGPRGFLPDNGYVPEGGGGERQAEGISLAEALRTGSFWIIMAVLVLLGLTTYAYAAHLVALLRVSHAVSIPQAAMLSSVSGITIIVSRVGFGWLFDRFTLPAVGAVGIALCAVAQFLLLRVDHFGALAIVMSMLFGASMGAETDLLTLLVGRYFGTKSLAKIYSWQNVAFLVGAALGPTVFSILLQGFSSAVGPVLVMMAVTVFAALLLLGLQGATQHGRVGGQPATVAP